MNNNKDIFNLNILIKDKIEETRSILNERYIDYDFNFTPFLKPAKELVSLEIIEKNEYDEETYNLILDLIDRYDSKTNFNNIDLDILNKLITKEIDVNQIKMEIEKCKRDVVYFANNYIQVKNKAEEGGYFVNKDLIFGDKVKYRMYPIHKFLTDSIIENDYVVGVKSRQIGFTTNVGAISLHKITFENNKTILVISKAYEEAKKTLEEWKFMYINLPFFLRRNIYKDNMGQLALGNKFNFSSIEVKTSGKRSGRSVAATQLILDEAEFIMNIDELWSAAAPTLSSTKGKCIVLSTPYEYKSQFYDLVKEGITNGTQNIVVGHQSFIPGRDEVQYNKQKALLNNDPEKIKTELDVQQIIPSDKYIDEDYLLNIKQPISLELLSEYSNSIKDPLIKNKFEYLIYNFDYIEFYNLPILDFDSNKKQIDYIFSFDPCEGGSDQHGISLSRIQINNEDGTYSFGFDIEFLGKTNNSDIIELIGVLNKIYPDLKVIIERNKGFKYLDILDKESNYNIVDEIGFNKTMEYLFKDKKGIFLTEFVRKKILNLIYNFIVDNHKNGIERLLAYEGMGLKYKNRRIDGDNGDDVIFSLGMTLIYVEVIFKLLDKKIRGINIKNNSGYNHLKKYFKVLIFGDPEYNSFINEKVDLFDKINDTVGDKYNMSKIESFILGNRSIKPFNRDILFSILNSSYNNKEKDYMFEFFRNL